MKNYDELPEQHITYPLNIPADSRNTGSIDETGGAKKKGVKKDQYKHIDELFSKTFIKKYFSNV